MRSLGGVIAAVSSAGTDLAHIRQLLAVQPALGRVALSRRVCQDLGWLNALGQPKEMSARVALLRMERRVNPIARPLEPQWLRPEAVPTHVRLRTRARTVRQAPAGVGAAGL